MEEKLISKISDLMDEKFAKNLTEFEVKINKRMDEKFAVFNEKINRRFDAIDQRLDNHDKRFDNQDKRFDSIEKFMKDNFNEVFKNQSIILGNQQSMKKDILFMKLKLEEHDKQLVKIV